MHDAFLMTSYESSFIQGQIALVRNECRQLRELRSSRRGLLALYERPFQYIRARAAFYRERGVSNAQFFEYLEVIEELEAAIGAEHRQA